MSVPTTRLFHNTRCSKSRGALDLLRERGIEPELVYYLETPPDAAQLRELLALLDLPEPPTAIFAVSEGLRYAWPSTMWPKRTLSCRPARYDSVVIASSTGRLSHWKWSSTHTVSKWGCISRM